MTHNNLLDPYLSSPNDTISFDGKVYQPIVFVLTRGRSEPIHYVFNYVKDSQTIYFVHKFQNKPPVLKALKNIDHDAFVPVHWYVAKDQDNVFYGAKKMKVTDVAAFKLVDEELRLYVDGHQFYDRYLNPLAFDIKTFELIPLSPDNRLKQWQRYNAYLESIHKPVLSMEHALIYSNYAVDKNGLYWRNPTTHNFITLEKRKIADLLHKPENEKNQDILMFINENPAIKTYDWYMDSLSLGN